MFAKGEVRRETKKLFITQHIQKYYMSPRYKQAITLLFFLVLIYFLSQLKFDVVYEQIIRSNKVFLSLGVLSLVLTILIKISRFRLIGEYYSHPISYKESALIEMVGISFAIITPARAGEGLKAILLNKRLEIPMTSSLGIIIVERLLDVLFLGIGAFIFSFYILKGSTTLLIGIFLVALIVFFVIFLRYFNAIKSLAPHRYRKYFREVKLNNNPILIASIVIETVLIWSLQAGLPWFVALSLGVSIPYLIVLGIVCISTIAMLFSILPAGLGTLDLSYLMLYGLVGVSPEAAVVILLVHRFFDIFLPFLFAVLLMSYNGLSINDMKDIMKRQK